MKTITIMEQDFTEHTYSKREAARIKIENGFIIIFNKNDEYVESIPAEGCEIYMG